MSKRAIAWGLAGLVGVCVGLAAPGCTRDPQDVLRFMIWGSPEEIQVVQGYLDGFREAHPEIPVQVEHAPSMGYEQKFNILVRGGNVPDVFYLRDTDVPRLAKLGVLRDLNPLIEADAEAVDVDDFYAPVFQRFVIEGATYGIAKDFATMVVYYNKDLFDKWDVPYPESDWTWEDFLRTAKALTHPDHNEFGFMFETWPEELFPWIWQAGGAVSSDDPPRWLMGQPEHVDASAEGLQFLRDLIWEHKVAPDPGVTQDQGGSALFQQGKVAMCTYGRWLTMELRHVRHFDWDVIEMPRAEERATVIFPVAYGVGQDTRKLDAAWTLVKYLTRVEAQEDVAHSGQAIPSRRSVAEGEAFLHPRALEGMTTAAAPHTIQVPWGRFSPRFPAAPELKYEFQRGVEPLWDGTRSDAKELLLELQPDMERILQRY